MVDSGLPLTPWSVAEALGTRTIPAELAAILMAHSRTIRMDKTPCTPEEHWGRGLHSFLAHFALGEVPVPGLERITLVGVEPDGQMHLMHSLFSVRVDVYSMESRLFACLGELPVMGLPLVMEIPPKFFATRRSVCAMPRSDHIAHLGGIFLLDWQTKPCKGAVGTENVILD